MTDGPGVLLFPMETDGWAEVVGYYVDGCTKVDVYQIAGWADGNEYSIDGWAEVVGYYVDGCTNVDVYQIAGRVGPDIYPIRWYFVDGWADGNEYSIDGWAEVVRYYVDGCTKVDVYQIAGRVGRGSGEIFIIYMDGWAQENDNCRRGGAQLCKGVKWKLVFQALFIKALRWKMKVLQYGMELCKVVKWKLEQSGPSSETWHTSNHLVFHWAMDDKRSLKANIIQANQMPNAKFQLPKIE
ncbi:hypothetical protein DEU56DRAFT_754212 [Suillus clintonianus]|uniref:uncharacterized protein n=1 Tax=Suillus clintonianus TaxID=1904413 RepID=UPI001B87A35D|nr:uncharacterized protein DEU56DRAFT_754212 [Suillus clintonianus]KAG2144554.1 hypothetical protein DEU56DRAFT_754212 [Suillus clintonianus]